MNNIIRTVVREHKWAPEIIGALFFDDADYTGLIFWYNDINQVIEELKKPKGKNKK